jgi:hypothetical protein
VTAIKDFVELFTKPAKKVVRGDELLQAFDSSNWHKFRCEMHGWVKGMGILRDGERYVACEMCICTSPDISDIEEDGAELGYDPRVPYCEDPYGGA